jgi:hypothetical protein
MSGRGLLLKHEEMSLFLKPFAPDFATIQLPFI